MYNQRDLVLIPFPYTDLTGTKQRPALIISNEKLNKTQDRLCVLVTSKPSKEGILITSKNFVKGKLPFKSWIKPHRIFTIDQKIVRKKLCTVDQKIHDQVINFLQKIVK